MAFGFGFNKQKVLNAAEKFVQQGKLQNAIAEYEKILKADPKDLTVANTVGDLHARLGESDKAIECFKSVGDAYASQGFTVKAIAMYKKLTKLKPTLESVLRLAELYTQQGLFNDARAQYLQVAEEFLRTGELEQAVRIFQKTLEMDPENVSMRTRLAEVYVRLGKKTEAWQIFAAAAESLRVRGSLQPAEEILQRMLKLDPGNSYALLMRGKNLFDAGDIAQATKNLEQVADLDSHPDGLRLLMQCYLQTGRLPEAGNLATKLFTVHNDATAITTYSDALTAAGHFEDVLQLFKEQADRLLSTDSAKVLDTLHSLIGHLRDNPAALESVLALLNRAGDTTHVTEVYELLAHAYVQSGELEKAREYYLKLTQLEPQNALHAKNYQQVIARLGGGVTASRLITAEEGAVMVDELEAIAPFIDQRYPDETALAVRAALTDAELFISYNMPAKALGPLLSALPTAPRDLRLNQRLAALHTRAGRFAEAAVCCRTLESLYHDAGHPDEASRYGELTGKYEERAAVDPGTPAPVEVAEPASATDEFVVAPKAKAVEQPAAEATPPFFHAAAAAAGHEQFHVTASPVPHHDAAPVSHGEDEVDVSDWESALSVEENAAPVSHPALSYTDEEEQARVAAEAVAETVEEVRFYLAHNMVEQARDAFHKLEKVPTEPSTMAALRAEIEAASHTAAAEPIEEVSVEIDSAPSPEEIPPVELHPSGSLDDFVSDLESSLGKDFLPSVQAQPVQSHPEPEPEPVATASAAAAPEAAGNLGEFVADLEASLGDSFLPEAPVPQAAPVAQTAPAVHAEPVHEPVPVTQAAPVVAPRPEPRIAPPVVVPAPVIQAPAASAGSAAAAATPALDPAAPAPTFTYQPTKIRPLAPAAAAPVKPEAAAGVDLADMFGELKQELEAEVSSADEDPETHYNLGVAFREMGLLDEAIGELQKVCQSVDRGRAFPQIMQTYTWLAQCFLDKGVPEAAIRWYESAVKLPGIDQETRMALSYELGSACEAAGDKAAALHHFLEVYGTNIDYRDVAERIKALKS